MFCMVEYRRPEKRVGDADYTAEAVRTAAARICDAAQARRLLAIAVVYDGMNRRDAAKIGGMDRQTLRD